MSEEKCCCVHPDAYDCFALRYDMSFDATHQEVERDGGPCECMCHDDDDFDDEDDWTYEDGVLQR